MITALRRPAWLTLALLAVAGPLLAARQGRLVGKVVDPAGKPVPGVTVTATAKDVPEFEKVTTTDGKGIFILDFDRIGVAYTYRFEKAGFVTSLVNQTWNVMGTERHQFVLQPGGAPAAAIDVPPPASASNPAITAFNEGVRAFEARDYRVATAKLGEALQHDPSLRQAWAALGQIHLEQKRYKEAAEAAEKAIALGAGGPSILRVRWEAYRHLDDAAKTQKAREELEKSTRLEEDAKRIHNEAVALAKIGNDKDAFARFKEAAEIDPSLQQAWLGMAVAGLKIGRAAEAAGAAKKILESDSRHEQALRIQYNAALQVGDEAKIADALVALAAIEPTTARDNLFKIAKKAFDGDDAGRAKETLLKVVALDPDHPRANYYLGVLFVREGAKSEARTHLQRFLRLAPNDPDAGTAKGLLGYIGG
jgi:tetratricopeptide (TPR) repeat protein